ncbi:MAG: hypothetical protein ABFS46_03245 [Myxococcota bacterium]
MEAISGLITLASIGLALVIGVRLSKLGRATKGPETWLALYFLLAQVLGFSLSGFLYMSWTDASRTLPAAVSTPLHAVTLAAANAGLAALYVFTWKTFYPRSARARRVLGALLAALAAAYLAIPATEGFAVRVMPGAAYWTSWVLRTGALVWLSFESLRYWGLLRRRMRIGLAEPLVTNRFLLLGIWAIAVFDMGSADPLARIWYVAEVGSTAQWIPELAHSIVAGVLVLTSTLGIAAVAMLLLIFFPTPAFRGLIEGNAAAPVEPPAPRPL